MPTKRPALEVADIFRRHGGAYRQSHEGHLSRDQLRVMGAIEACRTADLGGHVERCTDCGQQRIAYNSCRNRHCPKCQGGAAIRWLEDRKSDLLPVPYFHVVFTLPTAIAEIAYQNKAVVYGILFKAAAQTLRTIAAEPKHLGARIGHIAVLHSWGQNLQYHPHLHCIVPGGGLSPDGTHWIACRPGFFLSVRVLSRLFRRLFLELLVATHEADNLKFFTNLAPLADAKAFADHLRPSRQVDWVVYAKRPFAGPEQVLSYLARYTHRVAIANSRLLSGDDKAVTFKWKDYRHRGRQKTMVLKPHEFIRRFLLHVLPPGCHRIRHYGILANGQRKANLALCRKLLEVVHQAIPDTASRSEDGEVSWKACPCCGGLMVRIEVIAKPDRRHRIKRLDSS
ncbi:MAG: IS91 family transposase [Rhodospirillales bacterium]|nr:IS91 family transposase [Rhodospirillaceae bacterium]MDP6429170.1 IS91 family transposase [Rhodospirillales bacterium]